MNKKFRSTILTAALLGGGLISGGIVANAYDTTDPTPTDQITIETPVETDAEVTPNGLVAQVETDTPDTPDTETPAGPNGEQPAGRPEGRPEGQREGRRGGGGCGGSEAVAELLGLTPQELREAKDAGSSLAEVAASQGVAVDDVIQTIVDEKAEHIAEEVAEGDLTQAEADARLAEIEARTADRVNGVDAGPDAD